SGRVGQATHRGPAQRGGLGVQQRGPHLLVPGERTGVVDVDARVDTGDLPAPHHPVDLVLRQPTGAQLRPGEDTGLHRLLAPEKLPGLLPVTFAHDVRSARDAGSRTPRSAALWRAPPDPGSVRRP